MAHFSICSPWPLEHGLNIANSRSKHYSFPCALSRAAHDLQQCTALNLINNSKYKKYLFISFHLFDSFQSLTTILLLVPGQCLFFHFCCCYKHTHRCISCSAINCDMIFIAVQFYSRNGIAFETTLCYNDRSWLSSMSMR